MSHIRHIIVGQCKLTSKWFELMSISAVMRVYPRQFLWWKWEKKEIDWCITHELAVEWAKQTWEKGEYENVSLLEEIKPFEVNKGYEKYCWWENGKYSRKMTKWTHTLWRNSNVFQANQPERQANPGL